VYRTGLSFAGNVRTAEPPRAGGVSPPWYASILIRQETLGVAGALLDPRRANARRSWLSALQYVHLAANERCAPAAAGVSQLWCEERVGLRKAFAIARAIPNHGGLTPAALVNERSCSANGAIPRWNVTSCTKSGRRKPTVANVTHPPVGNAYQQRHPFTRPGVSGVSQLCDASFPFGETRSPLPVRLPNHGGLTPAALGCVFEICRATFDSHGAVVV
jgi:hypothetical protein